MSATNRERLNLHNKLNEVLGSEEANTLMEHLPPVSWHEVATKDDVTSSEIALRSDIETTTTALRSDISAMGKELRAEMSMMRTQLRAEMSVGLADIRSEMTNGFNRQIKWLVTFGMAWSSLLVALTRFAG